MELGKALALAHELESPQHAPRPPQSRRGKAARRLEETILALKLRKVGHSYQAIAEVLSQGGHPCTPTKANKLVLKALAALERMQDAEALQLRSLDLERLDDWARALEGKIAKGDPRAVLAALAVQGRRLALQGMPLAAMQGGASQGAEAGSTERVEGGGLGLLAYAELRVGLGAGASGQGVEALRALLGEALQAGAMRGALPATPAPLALPLPNEVAIETEALSLDVEPPSTALPEADS